MQEILMCKDQKVMQKVKSIVTHTLYLHRAKLIIFCIQVASPNIYAITYTVHHDQRHADSITKMNDNNLIYIRLVS